MRKLKPIFAIWMGIFLLAGLGSCEKYFEEPNKNPNQPEQISLDMLLPTSQAALAYGNGGDLSRTLSLAIQQTRGAERCYLITIYSWTESDMDNWWRFNMYGGSLMDLHKMIEIAEAKGNKHYKGVAEVLMAYGILTLTDMFGDVPFSEAFGEAGNTTPKWDTQEEVYNAVFELLADAKSNLKAGNIGLSPGAEDLVFGGDLDKWSRTANLILARAYLHLGKLDNGNYQNALDALGTAGVDSYGSNADNAVFNFGTSPTESAPWYQWITQRDIINYHANHINLLMAKQGDPRLEVYFDTPNLELGEMYAKADAAFYFATYVEQKFIEAEAALQTNDASRAANAHNEAVMASLALHGVSDATFEAAHAQHTAGTIDLEEIIEQKYVALFLGTEPFTDWRRTGFPELVPDPNNVTGGEIPRRLPYPQSERLYNGANFQDVSILSRVWWDVP